MTRSHTSSACRACAPLHRGFRSDLIASAKSATPLPQSKPVKAFGGEGSSCHPSRGVNFLMPRPSSCALKRESAYCAVNFIRRNARSNSKTVIDEPVRSVLEFEHSKPVVFLIYLKFSALGAVLGVMSVLEQRPGRNRALF